MTRELTRKPLCGRCVNGNLEDEDGNITGRCPCRTAQSTPEQERDLALTATADANPNAFNAALRIITDTATAREVFSANDCRAEMEIAGIPGPVIGTAFGQASRNGVIRFDGYVRSSQASTKDHPVKQWRSLIHRPGRRTA